jgi:membrane protein
MVFSLVPLLVVVIAVAGLVLGSDATVRSQVLAQARSLVGAQGERMLSSAIDAANAGGRGVVATVLGGVTLLAGATGAFGELQDSLDTIWEVQRRRGGLWALVRDRALSMAMVLGVAVLLLVSLLLSAALNFFLDHFGGALATAAVIGQVVNVGLSLAVIWLLFAAVFKVLPHTRVEWSDVWLGALVTALLFVVGKELLALYLGTARVVSAFGAAGSLVIVLLWVYYSAQILFFGAEFTQVWAHMHGSKMGGMETR